MLSENSRGVECRMSFLRASTQNMRTGMVLKNNRLCIFLNIRFGSVGWAKLSLTPVVAALKRELVANEVTFNIIDQKLSADEKNLFLKQFEFFLSKFYTIRHENEKTRTPVSINILFQSTKCFHRIQKYFLLTAKNNCFWPAKQWRTHFGFKISTHFDILDNFDQRLSIKRISVNTKLQVVKVQRKTHARTLQEFGSHLVKVSLFFLRSSHSNFESVPISSDQELCNGDKSIVGWVKSHCFTCVTHHSSAHF